MQTFTSGSAVENEPEQNLADDFEHWPNEPATRNDLRILSTRINHRFDRIHSRFDRVDAQFEIVGFRFAEQKQDLLDAVRREIFIVAAFMFGTIIGLTAVATVFYR
ncbi:MAG: hypothetical protein RL729_981 [Actinomycetota bacterium]|jgi:tetrahydromethanopterin S-methyltransferase subunit G